MCYRVTEKNYITVSYQGDSSESMLTFYNVCFTDRISIIPKVACTFYGQLVDFTAHLTLEDPNLNVNAFNLLLC